MRRKPGGRGGAPRGPPPPPACHPTPRRWPSAPISEVRHTGRGRSKQAVGFRRGQPLGISPNPPTKPRQPYPSLSSSGLNLHGTRSSSTCDGPGSGSSSVRDGPGSGTTPDSGGLDLHGTRSLSLQRPELHKLETGLPRTAGGGPNYATGNGSTPGCGGLNLLGPGLNLPTRTAGILRTAEA